MADFEAEAKVPLLQTHRSYGGLDSDSGEGGASQQVAPRAREQRGARSRIALQGLPNDVFFKILSYMDAKSVTQLAATSKALKARCEKPDVWTQLLLWAFSSKVSGRQDPREEYISRVQQRQRRVEQMNAAYARRYAILRASTRGLRLRWCVDVWQFGCLTLPLVCIFMSLLCGMLYMDGRVTSPLLVGVPLIVAFVLPVASFALSKLHVVCGSSSPTSMCYLPQSPTHHFTSWFIGDMLSGSKRNTCHFLLVLLCLVAFPLCFLARVFEFITIPYSLALLPLWMLWLLGATAIFADYEVGGNAAGWCVMYFMGTVAFLPMLIMGACKLDGIYIRYYALFGTAWAIDVAAIVGICVLLFISFCRGNGNREDMFIGCGLTVVLLVVLGCMLSTEIMLSLWEAAKLDVSYTTMLFPLLIIVGLGMLLFCLFGVLLMLNARDRSFLTNSDWLNAEPVPPELAHIV